MNITVRYNVFGLDEEDAQELEMEVSDRQYDKLESYVEDGELLDEDFLSTEMPGLHKKILQAIHDDIEDREIDFHIVTQENQGGLPWMSEKKDVLFNDIPEDFHICGDDEFVYEIDL